jgi:hypothetical protein
MTDRNAELIKRRHPRYEGRLAHWDFIEATYEGGREWFAPNIFRYVKEGDDEYAARVKRAYRFNHTKQVVDLVDKHLFKMPIARKVEDAPDCVKRFWKNSTLSGLNIDTFMRRVSNATSRFGRVYVVVDSTRTAMESLDGVLSVEDEKAAGGRPYAYIVRPQDMLDMSYGETGALNWCLVREIGRDDADPLESSGDPVVRYRLWTTEGWYLFQEVTTTGRRGTSGRLARTKVELIDVDNHGLGVVPVVQADHTFSEEPYESAGLIDDIAYLDRANANYLSNLDAIIQDQTFSQLTMPAQGILPGEEGHDKLLEMGTKRIFTYDGQAGQKPEYISPDPRQASMILAAIGKIINEIYHSVGLSAERTKDDSGGGIDNASGVAKAYDFERVNSLLTAKAATLQLVEDRLTRLVCMWEGEDDKLDDEQRLAVYPEKFDTRGLYDEFEIAARLSLLAAPDEVRRAQMALVIEKMFPAQSEEQRKKLEAALKDWPPEPPPVEGSLPGTEKGGAKSKAGGPIAAAGAQKTAKELTA